MEIVKYLERLIIELEKKYEDLSREIFTFTFEELQTPYLEEMENNRHEVIYACEAYAEFCRENKIDSSFIPEIQNYDKHKPNDISPSTAKEWLKHHLKTLLEKMPNKQLEAAYKDYFEKPVVIEKLNYEEIRLKRLAFYSAKNKKKTDEGKI